MHVYTLQREQLVPLSPVETFDFFADAFNLEAITPPWLGFEVATPRPIAMAAGALIEYRLKLHALPLRWLTRIEAWEPGRRFADRQLRGPYRLWHHTHAFAADERGTVMRDFGATRCRSVPSVGSPGQSLCAATSTGSSTTGAMRSPLGWGAHEPGVLHGRLGAPTGAPGAAAGPRG
jgi:ligand-binding SRPBCC domain-containing protein